MFNTLNLFQTLACPDRDSCTRPKCIFSHKKDVSRPLPLNIRVETPQPAQISSEQVTSRTIPAKRPAPATASSSRSLLSTGEPPRKVQKLGLVQKPAAPTSFTNDAGVPVLRVNAAQSQVPVPVRQAMLKSVYDHFVVLYQAISSANPTLASEHALKQEEEVYKISNKFTYRNAIKLSIAAVKRRKPPTSVAHESVGTEADVAEKAASKKTIAALSLTQAHLEPLVMSMESMRTWGYFVQIPDGPGGEEPSLEKKVAKCERCAQPFQVKKMSEADECTYHWGKPFSSTANAERLRLFSCCSRPTNEGGGCDRGPHVFYERDEKQLHARHPFTFTRPGLDAEDTAFFCVVLDCEMIYTTGGMRVARVSVVDGEGKEIFDEMVRMDDDVEIIDYNTRFSGVTEENHSNAVLNLTAIRQSLDAFINSETIIIGHALDNDLKTLRMIHHRCIDTAILFPHRLGPPYRRALRDLCKEHMGLVIQAGGGTVGHSSVEDCIATLNLVRWFVLNKAKPTTQ